MLTSEPAAGANEPASSPTRKVLPLPLRFLHGVFFWALAFLMTLLGFILALLQHIKVLATGAPRDGRPIHRVATMWGRGLLLLTPGWKVTVEGTEHIPRDGRPMVVVANHESMTDIWAMYYLKLQFRWLSKESIFRIPFVGWAMRWARYVPIRRGDSRSHAQAMEESANILKEGLSMFFFPEGTRSKDGRVKPFKLGAFKLARDNQVPVLPVAIHGAGGLLPKGSALPGVAHVQIRVLPPVDPPAEDADLSAYAERIRGIVVQAHEKLV